MRKLILAGLVVVGGLSLSACANRSFPAECEVFPERCCDLAPEHLACTADSSLPDTIVIDTDVEAEAAEPDTGTDSTLEDSGSDGDTAMDSTTDTIDSTIVVDTGTEAMADSTTPETIADTAVCSVGEKRCTGSAAEICSADRTRFVVSSTCSIGCDKGTCIAPIDVAAGQDHSCVALSDATVRCWGRNDNGQLATGSVGGTKTKPAVIAGLAGATRVSAGHAFSCALTSASRVSCWGQSAGLGDGSMTDRATPALVPGVLLVTAISCGAAHCSALISDGAVAIWGDNSDGAYGDGTTDTRVSPAIVPGLTGVGSVSAGGGLNLVGLIAGGARAWGFNGAGHLGDGTTTTRTSPVTIAGYATLAKPAAGGAFTCAIMSDATVRCTGANADGELGDGTLTSRTTPATVVGVTGAIGLSAGKRSTACAIVTGGGLRCWGNNSMGQVGDGTTTKRASPVSVALTGTTHVSVGLNHTCAIADGDVWCWGDNSYGQLGDGTTASHKTPARVAW